MRTVTGQELATLPNGTYFRKHHSGGALGPFCKLERRSIRDIEIIQYAHNVRGVASSSTSYEFLELSESLAVTRGAVIDRNAEYRVYDQNDMLTLAAFFGMSLPLPFSRSIVRVIELGNLLPSSTIDFDAEYATKLSLIRKYVGTNKPIPVFEKAYRHYNSDTKRRGPKGLVRAYRVALVDRLVVRDDFSLCGHIVVPEEFRDSGLADSVLKTHIVAVVGELVVLGASHPNPAPAIILNI